MITITTDQIMGIGIIGLILIFLGGSLAITLVKSVVGRTLLTCLALLLILTLWISKGSIEESIKACDPHILFLHLQISDPDQLADCQQIVNGDG